MHPFGGTPVCPRCSKAVYAAEQVMGPGRKLYHKPCLSCKICKKRLDSYTLLEHDQEPYCKSCHTRNFGTRDLRQANLPVRETSTSPTPASNRPKGNSPPPAQASLATTPIRVARETPPAPTYPSQPTPASYGLVQSARSSLDDTKEPQANNLGSEIPHATEQTHDAPAPLRNSPSPALNRSVPPPLHRPGHKPASSLSSLHSPSTSPTEFKLPSTFAKNHNTTSAALSLLEKEGIHPLVQTTTGTRYGAALGGKLAVNTTGTPTGSPRKWGGETPLCPKCSQRVYFAEQIKAVGKTWHKNCLRCCECNTLLDSNRLRDHDGDPLCVRCYSKLHGPQGSGYALLGKAGG